MSPRSRAIVLRRRDPPSPAALAAEIRLAGLVQEVFALEDRLEAMVRELALFEARYREATCEAFADLERSERLLGRVRRLEEEVKRLSTALAAASAAPARGERATRRAAAARHGPVRDPAPARRAAPSAELLAAEQALERDLKALHRRLARVLHPDLARGDDAERARLSDLMASANDAYARGDRAALELLAERVGATDAAAGSEAERLARLARRIGVVERARTRLASDGARLAASTAARLRAEAAQRSVEGGDLLTEARESAQEGARLAREKALAGMARLAAGARALTRARRQAEGPAPGARRGRARDPVSESPLVRRRPTRADLRRATPAARALALWLERHAAGPAPWDAALTVLAYLAEAGGRLPEALGSIRAFQERWDALRAGWPGAPDLAGALALAPRHVDLGLRWGSEGVEAGVQLSAPELLAGVRDGLRAEAAKALARRALTALGPRERCGRCGADAYAIHLLRVRGIEELHGLACPSCAAVLRSFRRYGEPDALESLSGVALEVGLVVEQPLRLAGAPLAFQMLPVERARLTARALLSRFRELCLERHGIELAPGALALEVGRTLLAPGARVPERARVSLVTLPAAGLAARDLLDLVRRRVERRFRGD